MKLKGAIIGFLAISLLIGCQQQEQTKPLRIAASANMRFTLLTLIDSFTLKTHISCELISGSSGKLTTQISNGAPYDLFFSADMNYPDQLYQNGFSMASPIPYAQGKLVLWTRDTLHELSVNELTAGWIKHVSLANPQTAPYGKATLELLRDLRLYDRLADKLVYGESVMQASQHVTSGTAEVGFIAKSLVLTPGWDTIGNWMEIPETSYKPILQGVVVLSKSQNKEKADMFLQFIFSDDGTEILNKFGYSVPSE